MDKFELMSKEDLITFARLEQDFRVKLLKEVMRLRSLNDELKEQSLWLGDQLLTVKSKIFGKSSEQMTLEPASSEERSGKEKKKEARVKVQLPSERYPDATIIERDVTLATPPECKCCQAKMSDSGMTEDSEFLTVIPKQFLVIRQKRHKYRCGNCHGDIVTAPAPPRIKEGSTYSDEMMVDVALTKYCDLVPIERYAAMAGREGLKDLPAQSLIETTHYVADAVRPAYGKLKQELTPSLVLHADETPHRMLEGDRKSNWFLWGFSGPKTSFFECHDTRSGDVAAKFLNDSSCEYLACDVYTGYGKAVRETNEIRHAKGLPKIQRVYCNAHARRKFVEAFEKYPNDAEFFIKKYQEIYHLESESKGKPPDEVAHYRARMIPLFEQMREKSFELMPEYSTKSTMGKALRYYTGNLAGFTLFTKNPSLPIDNNSQERLLRNPVIGRKTWYGTHSRRGAETAAILFSLVESCKLNRLNPREYFRKLIAAIHAGQPALTPKELAELPN